MREHSRAFARTLSAGLMLVSAVWLAMAREGTAATIVAEPFDALTAWHIRTVGAASARLHKKGLHGTGLRVEGMGGMAFCTRELPLQDVRGSRLTVRCMTKVQSVEAGPQACSTPKVHLAVATPRGVLHFSSRLTEPSGWRERSFNADVPKDASKVRLNVGIENAFGSVVYDSLVVESDRKGTVCLDLREVANARFSEAVGASPGLRLPTGRVVFDDVPFEIIDPAATGGRDCVALRGVSRIDLPETTPRPVRVGSAATAVYLLHAAVGGAPMRETPCVIWSVRFWDGHESSFSVFEGREIGAVGSSKHLENWRVVWRGKSNDGKPVVLGMTKWRIYSAQTPVESIVPNVYVGGSPTIVAITVVNDPVRPVSEDAAGDEWEAEWE